MSGCVKPMFEDDRPLATPRQKEERGTSRLFCLFYFNYYPLDPEREEKKRGLPVTCCYANSNNGIFS